MQLERLVGRLVEPTTGRSWEPSEIAVQVASRAAALADAGLGAGDRVFLHHGNCLEFFADLLATWRLGACAVPLDRRLTAFEIDTLGTTAKPSLHVVDEQTSASVLESLDPKCVQATAELGRRVGTPPSRPRPQLDDDALILFTSGSTGDPKGVVHTHRSLRARWTTLRQSLGLEAYRRTLCLLPTHFGHGLICNCLFPWLDGQDLFIAPPFRAELIMRLGSLIDEHEISFLSSVPSVWRLALKLARPPERGTLRRVHVGSAPLFAELWADIQTWASTRDVRNAYGITETGSWVAGLRDGDVRPEDGLIGEGWGSRIRVLRSGEEGDPLEDGAACAPGEEGFVWLDTPALMKGYFQRDDLTEAVVRQGWFLTGDIGLLDERGRLYLKGRERDEINKGGMKVHPADIDGVVGRFTAVSDACAFGYPDELYGENVGLAVVLDERSAQTLRELHAWLAGHLAEHKMPVRWHVLEEIPRTSRGKINRASVAERCAAVEPLDMPSILKPGEQD